MDVPESQVAEFASSVPPPACGAWWVSDGVCPGLVVLRHVARAAAQVDREQVGPVDETCSIGDGGHVVGDVPVAVQHGVAVVAHAEVGQGGVGHGHGGRDVGRRLRNLLSRRVHELSFCKPL